MGRARRRFVAGVGVLGLARAGQAVAAFATIVVLAAALDAPALGVFGVYETLFALMEVLVDGGSGNALVRRGGARAESLRPALRQALRFRAATAAVAAALMLAAATADPLVDAARPAFLLAVLCLGSHLATAPAAVFHLRLAFGIPSALRTATALAVLATTAALALAGARDPLLFLAGAQLARAAGNLALGWSARRYLPDWPDSGPPEPAFARECLMLGAGAAARELYGRLDLLLIRALLGAGPAGIYTPIRKTFHLAVQLPAFAGIVAMPTFAARAATPDLFRRSVLRLARRLALLALPGLLLGLLLAPWLVRACFGDAFASGIAPLRLLAFAAFLVFPGSILTTGLVARGAAGQALAIALASLAVAAAGLAALVPAFGLSGAAAARGLAELAALLGAWWAIARLPRPTPLSTARVPGPAGRT